MGGLLGSVFSGPVGHIVRPGRAMLISISVFGAAVAGFGAADHLWLALACLAVAGAADTTTVVLRSTVVQTVIPDNLRGRISAAEYVVGVGGPQLGGLEPAPSAPWPRPTISAVSGGLATVAGAVVIGLALPAFARYRRLDPGPAADAPAQATA